MKTIPFLGKEISLSDSLLYDPHRDYWVHTDQERKLLTFGLTPAGIIREGGYRSIEYTVNVGEDVLAGDTIAVAVTGKIKYLEAPVAGRVLEVNRQLEKSVAALGQEPCVCWWLLRLSVEFVDQTGLVDLAGYTASLEEADRRAAHGAGGAGSPTCRSVYEAIRVQKEGGKKGDC